MINKHFLQIIEFEKYDYEKETYFYNLKDRVKRL